jgi:hypothetical protein
MLSSKSGKRKGMHANQICVDGKLLSFATLLSREASVDNFLTSEIQHTAGITAEANYSQFQLPSSALTSGALCYRILKSIMLINCATTELCWKLEKGI